LVDGCIYGSDGFWLWDGQKQFQNPVTHKFPDALNFAEIDLFKKECGPAYGILCCGSPAMILRISQKCRKHRCKISFLAD